MGSGQPVLASFTWQMASPGQQHDTLQGMAPSETTVVKEHENSERSGSSDAIETRDHKEAVTHIDEPKVELL